MRHEKIEAGSCDASPNENCVSTAQTHSKNSAKNQAKLPAASGAANINDWRDQLVRQGYFDKVDVVTGELGPIHVLGSPRVVVATRDSKTFCWVEEAPWGWGDRSREFLKTRDPGKHHPAAMKLALELANDLKARAERELERRERLRAARFDELMGRRDK